MNLFHNKLQRFQQLLNCIYPENELPDWSSLFGTANFVKTIQQDDLSSCGIYTLYFMQRYDGESVVGDKRKVHTKYIIQAKYT